MEYVKRFWLLYLLTMALVASLALGTSRAVTTIGDSIPVDHSRILVIDAGHGGMDGGAVSCTGVLESQINLQIALRLEDLAHLLGYRTLMLRKTDESLHTEGNTIAAKKASDLRQRVRLVNATEGAILLSIHQNFFPESIYYGPQLFYAPTEGSDRLAEYLQQALQTQRQNKPGQNIYLLQHIQVPGVLVECGFLSNPKEEAMLRDEAYQKILSCRILSGLHAYLQA